MIRSLDNTSQKTILFLPDLVTSNKIVLVVTSTLLLLIFKSSFILIPVSNINNIVNDQLKLLLLLIFSVLSHLTNLMSVSSSIALKGVVSSVNFSKGGILCSTLYFLRTVYKKLMSALI